MVLRWKAPEIDDEDQVFQVPLRVQFNFSVGVPGYPGSIFGDIVWANRFAGDVNII